VASQAPNNTYSPTHLFIHPPRHLTIYACNESTKHSVHVIVLLLHIKPSLRQSIYILTPLRTYLSTDPAKYVQ